MEFDLHDFARTIHFTVEDLSGIPLSYRSCQIPKQRGGVRTLHIPNSVLMGVQRIVLRQILCRLPCHPLAKGFRQSESIVTNAQVHVGQAVILKLDIKNFFTTTAAERITDYFRNRKWSEESIEWLVRICVCDGGLPQGAPTSPCLSNIVNSELDARLNGLAKAYRGSYSRYADDITFSFRVYNQHDIRQVTFWAGEVVSEYGYHLNCAKRCVIRRHHQQRVTGLVVNEQVNLPRKLRRRIRSAVHRLNHGQQLVNVNSDSKVPEHSRAPMTQQELEGWLAFAEMVERQRERSDA